MIARTWWGATRAADADAYLAYLESTGLAAYRATPGNLGAYALRRLVDGRAEFLLVSFWESEAAVRAFARVGHGDDAQRAVFYPEDDRFLVERHEHVTHHEVVSPCDASAVGMTRA
jgi:heme-degrading monooxygenase HmoA